MMSQKSGALAELLQSPDEHVIGSAAAASKQQAQSENFKQRAAERVRRCIVRFMDRLLSKPNLLFMKFHLRVKAMQWNFIKSMNTKYLHKLERRWKMYKDKLREDQFTRLILPYLRGPKISLLTGLEDMEVNYVCYYVAHKMFSEVDVFDSGSISWRSFLDYLLATGEVFRWKASLALATMGTEKGSLPSQFDRVTTNIATHKPRKVKAVFSRMWYFPEVQRVVQLEEGLREIRILDPKTSERIRTLPGHEGECLGAEWLGTPHEFLFTSGNDKCVRIWEVMTGTLARIWKPAIPTSGWGTGSEGSSKPVPTKRVTLGEMEYAPGIFTLFAADYFGPAIYSWKVANEKTALRACDSTGAGALTYSGEYLSREGHPEIALCSVHMRSEMRQEGAVCCANKVLSLLWIGQLGMLASGAADGSVVLWNPQRRTVVFKLMGHTKGVTQLAYCPQVWLLLSGGFDTFVCLWDPNIGIRTGTLRGHMGHLSKVVCVPGTSEAVTMDEAANVKIWDLRRTSLLQRIHLNCEAVDGEPLKAQDLCIIDRMRMVVCGRTTAHFVRSMQEGSSGGGGGNSNNSESLPLAARYNQRFFTLAIPVKRGVRLIDLCTNTVDVEHEDILPEFVTAFDIDPAEKRFVVGDCEGNMRVFGFFSGQLLLDLQSHAAEVSSVEFVVDRSVVQEGGKRLDRIVSFSAAERVVKIFQDKFEEIDRAAAPMRSIQLAFPDALSCCMDVASGIAAVSTFSSRLVWVHVDSRTTHHELYTGAPLVTCRFMAHSPLLFGVSTEGKVSAWTAKPLHPGSLFLHSQLLVPLSQEQILWLREREIKGMLNLVEGPERPRQPEETSRLSIGGGTKSPSARKILLGGSNQKDLMPQEDRDETLNGPSPAFSLEESILTSTAIEEKLYQKEKEREEASKPVVHSNLAEAAKAQATERNYFKEQLAKSSLVSESDFKPKREKAKKEGHVASYRFIHPAVAKKARKMMLAQHDQAQQGEKEKGSGGEPPLSATSASGPAEGLVSSQAAGGKDKEKEGTVEEKEKEKQGDAALIPDLPSSSSALSKEKEKLPTHALMSGVSCACFSEASGESWTLYVGFEGGSVGAWDFSDVTVKGQQLMEMEELRAAPQLIPVGVETQTMGPAQISRKRRQIEDAARRAARKAKREREAARQQRNKQQEKAKEKEKDQVVAAFSFASAKDVLQESGAPDLGAVEGEDRDGEGEGGEGGEDRPPTGGSGGEVPSSPLAVRSSSFAFRAPAANEARPPAPDTPEDEMAKAREALGFDPKEIVFTRKDIAFLWIVPRAHFDSVTAIEAPTSSAFVISTGLDGHVNAFHSSTGAMLFNLQSGRSQPFRLPVDLAARLCEERAEILGLHDKWRREEEEDETGERLLEKQRERDAEIRFEKEHGALSPSSKNLTEKEKQDRERLQKITRVNTYDGNLAVQPTHPAATQMDDKVRLMSDHLQQRANMILQEARAQQAQLRRSSMEASEGFNSTKSGAGGNSARPRDNAVLLKAIARSPTLSKPERIPTAVHVDVNKVEKKGSAEKLDRFIARSSLISPKPESTVSFSPKTVSHSPKSTTLS